MKSAFPTLLARSWASAVLVVLSGCGSGENVDQLANGNTFPDAPGDVAADAKLDSSTVQGDRGSATSGDVVAQDASMANEDATELDRFTIVDAAADQSEARVDASMVDAGRDAGIHDTGADASDCGSDVCGSIGITINVCPQIQGFTINPINVAVGEAIHLTSSATDDNGDALTFLWTANQGVFNAASSPNTDYHCSTAGTVTLSLTVSDGRCDDGVDQDIVCHN